MRGGGGQRRRDAVAKTCFVEWRQKDVRSVWRSGCRRTGRFRRASRLPAARRRLPPPTVAPGFGRQQAAAGGNKPGNGPQQGPRKLGWASPLGRQGRAGRLSPATNPATGWAAALRTRRRGAKSSRTVLCKQALALLAQSAVVNGLGAEDVQPSWLQIWGAKKGSGACSAECQLRHGPPCRGCSAVRWEPQLVLESKGRGSR